MIVKLEQESLNEFAISSWAQAGEDLALERIFADKNRGFYIDIGAHHPERFSVTKKLHQKGWAGINVDADKLLIEKFKIKRPNDINIWAVVGSKPEYTFYEFSEKAISTTDIMRKNSLELAGRKLTATKTVPGLSLKQIFDQVPNGQNIDFLNLDIEGAELEALVSGCFQEIEYFKKPQWILVETKPPISNALAESAIVYLINNGYEPYLCLAMNTLLRKSIIQNSETYRGI